MKYSIVILHYMLVEETTSCINSIKKITNNQNCQIIIVDNASPNNSGSYLKDLYKNDQYIDVLINEENLGFAKGNNIGYQFAQKNYNPDFIVIMNNDIEIESTTFFETIEMLYNRENYAILGPDIYSTTFDAHQSPKRLSHYNYPEIAKLHQKFSYELDHPFLVKLKCVFKRFFLLRKIKYRQSRKKIDHRKEYFNVPLHGACLIFSKNFISKNEYAFYPQTFFYYETEILDYICYKHKMKTMFSPNLRVLHHQNASTNAVYNDIYKKTCFALKCNIESTAAFLELMKSKSHCGAQ